jgi:class 3 adenylate cyclase
LNGFLAAIGLRFADAETEQAFRRNYAESIIVIQRAGLTLGLVIMAMFLVRDVELAALLGPGPLTFRLFVIIPFFAVSLALTFTPWAIKHHQAFFLIISVTLIFLTFQLFSMAIGTAGMAQGTVGIVDPRFGFRTMSAMLLMIGVVMLSGLRFEYAIWCGIAVIVGWWLDPQTSGLEPVFWRPSFIQIIATFLLSAGASYWIERIQRDQFAARRALDAERAHSERLLSYTIPAHALARLKRGDEQIADAFLEAVVLFVDLAGFTDISKRIGPRQTVRVLDRIFTAFDAIVARAGLERVKTMGDGYLVIGGAGEQKQGDLEKAARAARGMIREVSEAAGEFRLPLALRVGLHVGPVIGGVIGRDRPTYDYWGDTLNIASRLEVTGEPGQIHCSEAVYWRLRNVYDFEARGPIELKGYSRVDTFYLHERTALRAGDASGITAPANADEEPTR